MEIKYPQEPIQLFYLKKGNKYLNFHKYVPHYGICEPYFSKFPLRLHNLDVYNIKIICPDFYEKNVNKKLIKIDL